MKKILFFITTLFLVFNLSLFAARNSRYTYTVLAPSGYTILATDGAGTLRYMYIKDNYQFISINWGGGISYSFERISDLVEVASNYSSNPYYAVKTNYNQYGSSGLVVGITESCPSGTELINSVCVPPPDEDGDGTPDKCDPDYPDFANLDCDGDNILNGVDPDIDGDDILNGNDSNPYVNDSDSSSEDSSKVCPATALKMTPVKDEASCSMSNPLFTVPDGELRYISYVMWDDCRKSCMADVLTCPYGQAIKDGRCQSVVPDIDDCLGRSVCRIDSFGVSPLVSCFKSCDCLTTEHPVPDSTTVYFYEEVSCANIKDDASELDDLRLNDDVNKTLPTDLLIDSNASADLDVSASMKVALESYAAAKESTQLDLLSESKIQSLQLVSANSKLTDIESSLKNFSAVATSNQKVIGDSLDSINVGVVNSNNLLGQLVDGQDTGNTLLEDIKGLITDLNTSSDGDSNVSGDYTESDGQATDRGNIDGSLSEFYTFLDNITNDFNNMKSMLDGGLSAPSMSSGSAPEFCAVVFGKQLCINLCDSFGQFYSVFYYIFTALFLLAALKIYYLAFKMRV